MSTTPKIIFEVGDELIYRGNVEFDAELLEEERANPLYTYRVVEVKKNGAIKLQMGSRNRPDQLANNNEALRYVWYSPYEWEKWPRVLPPLEEFM